MVSRVYLDLVTGRLVGVTPKPAFWPPFERVRVNNPRVLLLKPEDVKRRLAEQQAAALVMVETGENRTPRPERVRPKYPTRVGDALKLASQTTIASVLVRTAAWSFARPRRRRARGIPARCRSLPSRREEERVNVAAVRPRGRTLSSCQLFGATCFTRTAATSARNLGTLSPVESCRPLVAS